MAKKDKQEHDFMKLARELGKENDVKMSREQAEKIMQLEEAIEKAMASVGVAPEGDGLEIFCEAVAALVNRWARYGNWSPMEHVSYAGYVFMSFLEKGVTAEIQNIEDYIASHKMQRKTKGQTGN